MMRIKIKDLANEISERVDNPKESGIERFVGLEHYDSGEVKITRFGSTAKLDSSMKLFKKGDILIARRNVYLKRAGLAEFDGLTSGDSIVLRPKNEIGQTLLPFIFNTSDFWNFANKYADGSMSKRLSPKQLMEYEITIFEDEDKQIKTGEILWAIFNTVESYGKLISQMNKLVFAKFIELFGDPNFTEKNAKLVDALEIRDDLRKPLNDGERKSMKDGELYPYYGANGKVDEINNYLINCEAICIAEDCGSYGYAEPTSYIIRGKCWVNNHAHVLIPKECCDINYANVYLNLIDLTNEVNGTTRQKLTQGKLKELDFYLPDMALQKEFSIFVEESQILLKELENARNKLKLVKHKLMNKTFVEGE